MGYEEIVAAIEDPDQVFLSQLPALFITIARECLKRKVFKAGGMENVIKNIQAEVQGKEG